MMICRLFLGLDSVPIFLVEVERDVFFLCDLLWIKSFAPNTRCALRGTPLVYATTVFLVVFLCSAAKLQWSETPPMIIVLMLVMGSVANGMVPWTSEKLASERIVSSGFIKYGLACPLFFHLMGTIIIS